MKKIYTLSIFLIFIAGSSSATILTVSNNPDSPGQYTDLQEAINAASDGDTLYVSGSKTPYDGDPIYAGTIIRIPKTLTIIGAGYKPHNQDGLSTIIASDIGLFVSRDEFDNITATPDGTKLIGLEFGSFHAGKLSNATFISSDYFGADDITIERCKFATANLYGEAGNYVTNVIVKNCVFETFNHYTENFAINNMVLNSILVGNYYGNSFTMDHCIFMTQSFGLNSCTIQNSIFYGVSTAGLENCSLNNNITVGNAENELIYGTNTGSGNLIDQNPLFVDVTSANFDYTYDYHLQEGSPCINNSTDGSDIGIYGGGYPWPEESAAPYLNSPMPAIPQVLQMDIYTPVIPVDGELDVYVKAAKNN